MDVDPVSISFFPYPRFALLHRYWRFARCGLLSQFYIRNYGTGWIVLVPQELNVWLYHRHVGSGRCVRTGIHTGGETRLPHEHGGPPCCNTKSLHVFVLGFLRVNPFLIAAKYVKIVLVEFFPNHNALVCFWFQTRDIIRTQLIESFVIQIHNSIEKVVVQTNQFGFCLSVEFFAESRHGSSRVESSRRMR